MIATRQLNTMTSLAVWILLSASFTEARLPRYLSTNDERRARMLHVPRDSPVKIDVRETGGKKAGTNHRTGVTQGLNNFMKRQHGNDSAGFLMPCEDFDSHELDGIIAKLEEHTHPKLMEIYEESCTNSEAVCDKRNRSNRKDIPEPSFDSEHDAPLWMQAASEVVRNGKCYDAVMLYYHHLDEAAKKNILVSNPNFRLPLLPENKDALHFLRKALDAKKKKEKGGHHHGRRRLQEMEMLEEVGLSPNEFFHDHNWGNLTDEQQLAYQEQFFASLNQTYVQNLLDQYNDKSPCELAHATLSPKWSEETAIQAGFDPEQAAFYAEQIETGTFNTNNVAPPDDIPNTETPGAGYVDCDQAAQCLEGGDVQYMIQGVVRTIKVPGSGKIQDPATMEAFGEDLLFHTRTFEAMPESPSKFGPAKAGGDGTSGLLGPALLSKPGQTMKLFVKNNFADAQSYLGPDVDSAEDFWNRIQVITNDPNMTTSLGFAPWIPYNGPQWLNDTYPLNGSTPTSPQDMIMGAGSQNVPGFETGGFDIFNVHMHGFEVAPHLFYPPGTSDPSANWVEIKPNANSNQQCMCYSFQIAETQSPGDFIYHTHRHGTTTILTWGGMFGLSLTGEETVEEAKNKTEDDAPSLTSDLVSIAEQEGLAFDDSDVNFVVIYDSAWAYADYRNETTNETTVIVSDFLSGSTGHDGPTNRMLKPWFVNNEYMPTIEARTGALTEFRVVCVSAGELCAFQILEGDGKSSNSTIVPFDRVASDGITYQYPLHRKGNGDPMLPDVTGSEAFLVMGGGMREVVVAQFERPGTYTVWQRCNAFDDCDHQQLMTINVTGETVERKSIVDYELSSYRPLIPDDREVSEYRGLTFGTTYSQEVYPFPYYGVGDINGEDSQPFDITTYDIGAKGGTCGIWVIRSMDIVTHPFHIHVNPFQVLKSSSHFFEDNPSLVLFQNDYTPPFDTESGTAPSNIWRDTAMVPPYGYLVIKQCYDAGVAPSLGEEVETFGGKFVFHCHYLVHEDTGLIRNVILGSNGTSTTGPTSAPTSAPTSSVHDFRPAKLVGLMTFALSSILAFV